MSTRKHGLSEKKLELAWRLMADCETTGDIYGSEISQGMISHITDKILRV